MNKSIKKLLYYIGAFKIYNIMSPSNAMTVLMYHGFRNSDGVEGKYNDSELHIDSMIFEKHLQIIYRYCHPISLLDHFSGKKLPHNSVALTFDDGYHNNYKLAFPLLKKYNIPATIFVTTGFVDRTHFLWTDRLEYLVMNSQRSVTIDLNGTPLLLKLETEIEKINTLSLLKKLMKEYEDDVKVCFLEKMEKDLALNYNWGKVTTDLLPLTWDEIREMKDSGLVTIGAHTVSHPILSKCTTEKQRFEIKTSKDRISDEIREECVLFAYPNGQPKDYTPETIRILKECGYRMALTTRFGYAEKNDDERFMMKRFGTSGSLADFACIVSGFSRLFH